MVSCNELQGGGSGLYLSQEHGGIPPKPPFRHVLAGTGREQKQAGKNSFPPTPPLRACLGFAPKTFGRTDGGTEKKDNIAVKALAPPSRARAFGFLLPKPIWTKVLRFGIIVIDEG